MPEKREIEMETELKSSFDLLELLAEGAPAETPTPNGLNIEWLMDQLDAPKER